MGNSSSRLGASPAPNGRMVVPAPRSDLSVGFSGDMNRQVVGYGGGGGGGSSSTSPPGISVGGFRGVFRLREVESKELQDARFGWMRMKNAIPVYVEVPDMGVCVTEYYRSVGGMLTYVVYKVHPLNPELDLNIHKRYEVPFMAGKRQLVWPMEVAINGLWPTKDTVFFINDKGETYKMDFHELLQVEDQKIRIAVGALKKDYPDQLSSALSFRPVATPSYSTYGQGGKTQAAETYTTLSGGSQADALYAALDQQYKCSQPPTRAPRVPPRQQIIIPNCGFENGVNSVFNRGAGSGSTFSASNNRRGGDGRSNSRSGGGSGFNLDVPPYAVAASEEASKEHSEETSKIGSSMTDDDAGVLSADVAQRLFRSFPAAIGEEILAATGREPLNPEVNEDTTGRLNTAEFTRRCHALISDAIDGADMLRIAASNCSSLNGELASLGCAVQDRGQQQCKSIVDSILEEQSHTPYSY